MRGGLPMLVMDRGPSNDMKQALRDKLRATTKPRMLWGDGAFDCEARHKSNWKGWCVPSYAPVTVRRADGGVNGLYRSTFRTPVEGTGAAGCARASTAP